jgi:hypothetical protein
MQRMLHMVQAGPGGHLLVFKYLKGQSGPDKTSLGPLIVFVMHCMLVPLGTIVGPTCARDEVQGSSPWSTLPCRPVSFVDSRRMCSLAESFLEACSLERVRI